MAYQRSPLMQERLADNRQRIILATRRLVAKGGFRGAAIAAVANEVGMSTGAIYRYFPSKAELFVEVLTNAVTHEVEILNAIIAGPGTATERLGAAVMSFAVRALEGPHLAFAFIAEPIDPEVDAARIVCRHRFGEVFERVLTAGVKSGEFPAQPVQITASCIVGAFTEALIRPVMSTTKRSDKSKLIDAIVSFCVRAAAGECITAGVSNLGDVGNRARKRS